MNKIVTGSLLVLGAMVSLLVGSKVVQADLPENFQVTQIIGSGLEGPTGFDIAPDGRIFILQRTGEVKIYKNGQLLSQNFAVLPSIDSGDRGLIGIAFDPSFSTNKYVYFYYTGLDLLNRLVRFTATTDVGTNKVELYKTSSPSELLHVGGSIAFGPDGKLYFAIGDNGNGSLPQQLNNPHGKILRINKDGSIPSDNPFFGQSGKLPEIWAYGFRNPWRFQFDSVTGRLFGGDVGEATTEEVNRIEKGKNYGWSVCEGPCSVSGMTNPIYSYIHQGSGSAVTGGPVYRGNMFPSEFYGDYFFGDYDRGFIRYLNLDSNGNSTGAQTFDDEAGSVVDLKVAPDGSMYYITYFPGRLYRITYSQSNQVPTAKGSASVTKGLAPLNVQFSSSGSSDPDGDPLDFFWDFGDGTTSTEENPEKTFNDDGTYIVELEVSDGSNTAQAVPIVIQVGEPPILTVGAPFDGATYRAGDVIYYSASAVDGAGFDLGDDNFSVEVIFHHHTHIHPFIAPTQGNNGQFTIPQSGHEPDADTWYEIKVTATDDHGLSDVKSVNIYPVTTQLNFVTNPPGLTVLLDNQPHVTPFSIAGVVGYQRTLSVPSPQTINGQTYQFTSWSDGGALAHTIVTPENETTYTANFAPGGSLSCGTPSTGAFTGCYYDTMNLSTLRLTRLDPVIDFNWGEGSPAANINSETFSARWQGNFTFNQGDYKFTVTADDGVRLLIDGVNVLDKWVDQSSVTNTVTKTLAAGTHTIQLDYYERYVEANVSLSWEQVGGTPPPPTPNPPPPAGSCAAPATGAFTGCYYDNMDFTNLKLSRTDSVIDFDWGGGSPNGAVGADTFSVRWDGSFAFNSGNYEFSVTGDDGIRLYIDGALVLDKWIDQGPTTYKVQQAMTAGTHAVRMEYYENGGGAVAELLWTQTSSTPPPPTPNPPPPVTCGNTGVETFIGCYYNNKDFTSLALTRTDSVIDFDWGGGSPDAAVGADTFSVIWRGSFTFEGGDYQFTARADDGIRVSVDGQIIIDEFQDQGPTTFNASKSLPAGNHIVLVEYYENGGGAVSEVSWQKTGGGTPPPPAPSCGTPGTNAFTGCYYDDLNFSNLKVTRTDPSIGFDWLHSSPDPSMGADTFSARWQGNFNFSPGNRTFTVTADDGVRLYIDNQLVLDKWIDQGPTTYTVSRNLSQGVHLIVLEYYENSGGAIVELSW